jgi:hypothetical protein
MQTDSWHYSCKILPSEIRLETKLLGCVRIPAVFFNGDAMFERAIALIAWDRAYCGLF